jgi:hypothetical protein
VRVSNGIAARGGLHSFARGPQPDTMPYAWDRAPFGA